MRTAWLFRKASRKSGLRAQGLASVGIELAVSMMIGVGLGKKADAYFGTHFLVLVGVAIGLLAGFSSLIRAARNYARQAKADANNQP